MAIRLSKQEIAFLRGFHRHALQKGRSVWVRAQWVAEESGVDATDRALPEKLHRRGLLQKQADTDEYAITALGVHILRPWWKRNGPLILWPSWR